MTFGILRVAVVGLGLLLLGGCAGGTGGVQAEAPASQENLVGHAPDGGQYVLYQASGFQNGTPIVVRIWTVNVAQQAKLGFRWVNDPAKRYASEGAFHLVAFADGQTRDLGAFTNRDVKYVWGGTGADIVGYFADKSNAANMQTLTLQ